MQSRADEFNASLLQAIDDAFLSLGESVKHVIYDWLRTNQSLTREEFPKRLGDLDSAILGFFGVGAKMVEKIIIKKICEKFNIDYKKISDLEFRVAIRTVRTSID